MKRKQYATPETMHEFVAQLAEDDFRGAACAGHSPYLWDGSLQGESHRSRKARHQQAMKICSQCPIKARCRDTQEQIPKQHRHGIWGGINYSAT